MTMWARWVSFKCHGGLQGDDQCSHLDSSASVPVWPHLCLSLVAAGSFWWHHCRLPPGRRHLCS
jgi:hypothetical protein